MSKAAVWGRLISIALAVSIAATTAPLARSAADNQPFVAVAAEEIILPNGFRMLVVEDRRVPRVAANIWYRIGSAAEPQGEHGSVHFLEHAIAQGTTTVGTRDFRAERPIVEEIHKVEQELLRAVSRERRRLREVNVFYDELVWPSTPEIDRLRQRLYELEDEEWKHREFWAEYNWYRRYGGIANHEDPVPATTSKEHMQFAVDLPAKSLELFFRLEADRMVNAVFRGWESQRFTVLEQRLGRQGRRETRFDYEAFEAVTSPHPSYHPSGGHLRDFVYFSRARMLKMYDDYFVPNNATLALVGDVDAATARTLGERYFGTIPRGGDPGPRMDAEAAPVPGGLIRLDWLEPLSPRVIVRHRIPGVGHTDRPAFDLLAGVLNINLSSSLTGVARLAGSVSVSAGRRGSPSTLSIDVAGRRDEDLSEIEAAVLAEIGRIHRGQIDVSTLEQARKSLRLDWHRTRLDRRGLATVLGSFEVMAGWETLQPYYEARGQASALDLQRLALEYLVPANCIIGTTRRNPGTSSPSEVTP